MAPRVSHTWLSNSSDSGLETNIHAILAALAGNAFFPNPDPTLASLQLLLESFITALGAAKGGGAVETAAKNAARVTLTDGVRLLGQYIDRTAENMEQLLSSKYPLQKERGPLGIQPAPENLRLKHGKTSGSIAATCDVSDHRVMYEWQTAIGQSPTDWTSEPPTNSSRTGFSGYTPGTWLNCRVRFRVPAGAGDWSSAIQIMVV